MKKLLFIFTLALACAVQSPSQEKAPLRLVKTIDVPGARHWDHFGVDLKGNRLFVTSEEEPAVEVFDLKTNQHLQSLPQLEKQLLNSPCAGLDVNWIVRKNDIQSMNDTRNPSNDGKDNVQKKGPSAAALE